MRGIRCIAVLAAALAVLPVSAATAQEPAPVPSTQQRPVHLVVFNKPGPSFARLVELSELALKHRDMYLNWAARGEIIASGSLEGEPVLGVTLFRRGADEQSIRRALDGDPLVKSGVLEVEFRHWSIQMGALPEPGSARPPPPAE